MKKSTIIKFHIGRGGRFNNKGHLSFLCEERIDEGDDFNSLFLMKKTSKYWRRGKEVGLTIEEAETGIGRIDIDGDYNTIYTTLIGNITRKEEEVLFYSDHQDAKEIVEFLGLNEESFRVKITDITRLELPMAKQGYYENIYGHIIRLW